MMKRVMLGWAVAAAVFVAGCDLLGFGEPEETPEERAEETKTPEPEPAGNFTAEPNGAGVTITAYKGFAEELVIPGTLGGQPVTAIGARAFEDKQLTSVYIPNGVTRIGDAAFAGNRLTSVDIPASVTAIGDNAFSDNRLTSVTIPNGVTTIGGSAFSGNQLTSVTIPNGVTAIGDFAFSGNQLTGVTISNGVTTIGGSAFAGNQLTRVTIPASVTAIGANAFSGNPLTSVTIGTGVTLGTNAFPGDFSTIYNDRGAGTYTRDTDYYDTWKKRVSEDPSGQFTYSISDGNVTITYYAGSAKDVNIPGTLDGLPVTEIGERAFEDKQLTSVTIPDSVTAIGEWAFAYNQLTSVTIPDSVTEIGEWAFAYNQLTSVTIPDSVTAIGDYAFSGNPLTSVTIGTGVTLGTNAFPEDFSTVYNDGGKLKGTYVSNSGYYWVWVILTADGNYGCLPGDGKLTVTYYAGSAKDVEIPGTLDDLPVTKIGERVFEDKQLTSVTIPDSVTAIGDYAFSDNPLTSVTIGTGVTLGTGAFPGNLADVYAEGGAGTYVYREKYGYSSGYYHWVISTPDGNYEYVPGDGKVTITDYTGSAAVVVIPGTLGGLPVTAIGERAFEDKQLTSVTVPDSVTTIGNSAFSGNPLTSVTMPAGVNLNSSAFPGNLWTVYNGGGKLKETYTSGDGGATWTKQQ
jgi:hypothetical protein